METSFDGLRAKLIPISLVKKELRISTSSSLVGFLSKDQEEKSQK
jgi:hypothetical protein